MKLNDVAEVTVVYKDGMTETFQNLNGYIGRVKNYHDYKDGKPVPINQREPYYSYEVRWTQPCPPEPRQQAPVDTGDGGTNH